MHGNRTMAPEWHNIDAVMLAWPHAQTDWAPWLEDARATYLNVIAAVNRNDAGVILLCAPSDVDDLILVYQRTLECLLFLPHLTTHGCATTASSLVKTVKAMARR